MEALVERFVWGSLFGVLGDAPALPNSPPVLEEATLTESLNVSLVGRVRDGRITDFKVTAAESTRA
jgi:hypothetical protein